MSMQALAARWPQLFSHIGHSYAHIMMLLYPTVVLALEPEMGRGYGELLMLMTAGNVLFGLGALPAGWLGDRWSAAGMMVVFFIGMGLSALFIALTTSVFGLALGLAALGLFASIYHPVGMAWLVRHAPNRGRALGLNGVFGSLGLAGAPVIAGLLTQSFGWRAAYLVPGLVSLATGLAMALCVRHVPVPPPPAQTQAHPAPHRRAMMRAFVVLSVTMLCTGLIYQTLSAALPRVLAERVPDLAGGTPAGAGILVSAIYLVAMGAQLLGGHLADRHSMRVAYGLVYLCQAPMLFLAASLSGIPVYLVISGAVLLNTVAIPVENTLLSHYSPEKWRGTAFGAKFVLALGVSALGVPVVALIHKTTGSFYWYFVLISLLSLVIALAALWLPRDRQTPIARPVVTVDS